MNIIVFLNRKETNKQHEQYEPKCSSNEKGQKMAAVKDVKPQSPHLIDELEESFQVYYTEHGKVV